MSDVHRLDHAELDHAARLLDDLGARRLPADGVDDPLLAALADWTTAIDTATSSRVIRPARVGAPQLAPVTTLAPVAASRGGRHRVVRRTVGGALLTAMALAGSSVAAALSGGQVPVLSDLGTVLVDAVPLLDAPADVGVRVSPPQVDATRVGGPVGAPVGGSTPLTVDLASLSTPWTAGASTAGASTAGAPTVGAPTVAGARGIGPQLRDQPAPDRAPGAEQGSALGLPSAGPADRSPAQGRPLVPPQLWLSPPAGLDDGGSEGAHGRVDRPGPVDGVSHGRGGGRAETVRQPDERRGGETGRPGHPSRVDVPQPPASGPTTTPCDVGAAGAPSTPGPRDDGAPPLAVPPDAAQPGDPTGPPVGARPSCEVDPTPGAPVETHPPVETHRPAEPEPPVENGPPVEVDRPVGPPAEAEPPVDVEPPAVGPPSGSAEPEPPAAAEPPAVAEPPATTESPVPPAEGRGAGAGAP